MKILMIGTGYVGLVSGTCFAELGADVTCVDNNHNKIENLKKGIMPIYENGLAKMVAKNTASGNLKFSDKIEENLQTADMIFIAVGTPSSESGAANLSYVFDAARTIAKNAKNGVIVVTKSTVPVGTNDNIRDIIKKTNPALQFQVASNPEFLREGNAIQDFIQPDRVVIGADSRDVSDKVAKLYQPISNVKIIHVDLKTAEMIKYTANAYLAMRVGFINEMADICESLGADVEKVAEGIGSDSRIGPKFLKTGPGFGGSCFPKDTRALQQIAENANAPSQIINSVISSNEQRKFNMAQKIIHACGGCVKYKNIGVLGLAFKANTDDIRESSALVIIEELLSKRATITAYDPEAMQNSKEYFTQILNRKRLNNLSFAASIDQLISDNNIVVIITEWPEFKDLNLASLKGKTIIDLRNLYNPNDMRKNNINYFSLGRK